jgi:hypothetical protein
MARSQKIKSGTVKVEGLAELNRALRAIGPDAQKDLKEASKKVAGFVATDAAAAARSLGGVAAHVAPSIRPVGGVSGAGVGFGGAAYPMAGGAEFGSIRFKQFQPWRGSDSSAGYFVYPSIRRDADRIVTEFSDAVEQVIARHFPLPI